MPIPADPAPRPLDHLCLMGKRSAPALVLRSGTYSHQELNERVGRLAAWLKGQVGECGARVASWAGKGEFACLMPLAAARAGLVHVPVNPVLKRAQVAHILADCEASLLVSNKGRLAGLQEGDVPGRCGVVQETDAVVQAERCDALPPSPDGTDTDALAAILYTSGSTGRPKGVMLSHANLWLGAISVAHYLRYEADDVVLGVLPLSFDYGQNQLLSAWAAGASVVPLDYLMPRDVMRACAGHGVTTLAAVPPLWHQLVALDWEPQAVATMRRLTNSGGALTEPLVRRLQALFPQADLYPMYGLTEAFRSTYLDPALVNSHPTSMGTAIPFAEVLVVDDAGDIAAPGEEGELVHCGPLVAQGYWQDTARTAERFRPAPEASRYGGKAVWSGDRVVRDAAGLLYFVGRRDAMIKSAGNRISPLELEEAALETGLVAQAAAFGLADERLGQAVHLVVTGEETHELAAALAKALPNFMQPRAIHWREAMPLNPNGKIDRTALLAELTAEQTA